MNLDFSRCRLQPFAHQREDVAWLLDRKYAFIASEMRTGKTKIVIDAIQFLFQAGVINKVIVVTPAAVRDVWFDEEFGELNKHLWENLHTTVTEFHTRIRTWVRPGSENPSLDFYVTNFEFLRSKARLIQLFAVCGSKTLLVGDESSFLKTHSALQTKAFLTLRRRCARVVLLNGTPIFHSPLDLYSQGNILHPNILDCKFITKFKARYAVQAPILGFGGRPIDNGHGQPVMKIDGWTNLEDLERRFKPHTVRRLQIDCMDLPPKLDPITLTATLDHSWKTYKAMRDEFVVWLQQNCVVTSATAAIKALRLAQITGGFLSGTENINLTSPDLNLLDNICTCTFTKLCALHGDRNGRERFRDDQEGLFAAEYGAETTGRNPEENVSGAGGHYGTATPDQEILGRTENVVEVGREKLDVLLWFIEQRLIADPNLHLVTWSRFRAEAFRAYNEVKQKFPQFQCGLLLGGQKPSERRHTLSLLKPETSPVGPVFVSGIEGTGSFGLDLCASHTCVTLSSGYSVGKSAQTLDRVYGPGQKFPIAYYDIVAVGPKGQRTIDHDILAVRRKGENIATRTAAAWVKAVKRE